MKRTIIALLSVLFFAVSPAFASYNLKHFSTDEKILAALTVLNNNGGEEVLDNLAENGVKIIFYDLTMMDFNYSKDYAIASVGTLGERYILINSRYKNSPKEALACLIAHESFHKLKRATFAEEVKCTQVEAYYWHKLKNQVTNTTTNELTNRLNKLESLYLASTPNNDRIADSIIHNQFYRAQLAIK